MAIKDKVKSLLEFSPFPTGGSDMGRSINEMPHLEYLPGKFIDFKSELRHQDWFQVVIKLFKDNKSKEQELIDNFMADRPFVLFFKSDFNKLKNDQKANVKKNLPQQFIKRMGI